MLSDRYLAYGTELIAWWRQCTRTLVFWTVVALPLCILPDPVTAEDQQQSSLPDKFMIRGGFSQFFGVDSNLQLNNSLGFGTEVDFAKTLGGTRNYSGFRLDAAYRFLERHRLEFTYYRVLRNASRTLQGDLTVDDITISAGASAVSSLNVDLWRLIYSYSFYRSPKLEASISPGLYMARVKYRISGSATCSGTLPSCVGQPVAFGDTFGSVTVPLPSIGGILTYHLTPKLKVYTRGDFFFIEVNQFRGSMFELFAGIEYRLLRNFALGAAYDRLQGDVTLSSGASGTEIETVWNSAYVYGALYF